MEDDLNGRRPQLKTTSMEYNLNGRLNGRRNQWKTTSLNISKTTSMEDDLNGRRPQWKTNSMKVKLNGVSQKLIFANLFVKIYFMEKERKKK